MIKFTENKEDIIQLWSGAFGDTRKDVLFFIDNAVGADCLAYYEGKTAASMLYLVDCFFGGKKGKYIYAACTDSRFRKQGMMSKLLEYAATLGYPYICLIPATDNLINYYSKRGFNHKIAIEGISFEQIPEIKEYLFEGYRLTVPCALMNCKGE